MQSNDRKPYYKSRFFQRLFLSYAIVILTFMVLYSGWYIYSYGENAAAEKREYYKQVAMTWGTSMDREFLIARSLCSSVNTSQNCRTVLQTAYVENKVIDSMQLYRLLNELTRIKASSATATVYSVMLGFLGDQKLYAPNSVLALKDPINALTSYPQIRTCSVTDLLNVTPSSDVILNSTFVIYADRYTGITGRQSGHGIILVLMKTSALKNMTDRLIPEACAIKLLQSGEEVLSIGESSELSFDVPSLAEESLVYRCYLPPELLKFDFPVSAVVPLVGMALVGIIFMLLTYQMAKRYYRPISSIRAMVQPASNTGNEFDGIIEGIRSLIGERNGYREKMVTISPFAQQGMLHSIMSGSVEQNQLHVLINEQFVELSKPCFMLALVDLIYKREADALPSRYKDACELIAHVCRERTQEDCSIVSLVRDERHVYVIASGESAELLQEQFYDLHTAINEAIGDANMLVTFGVSRPGEELERLPEACREADQALAYMLSGGRGCVYFRNVPEENEKKRFFFQKDCSKRILEDIRSGQQDDLNSILDELYERNIRRADLSPSELESMADELHVAVRAAVSEAFAASTTHFDVTRPMMPATMEEILLYYRHVFQMVMEQPGIREHEKNDADLENEVCSFIEANLYRPDLSQNSVADQFGLSSKSISTICKNRYGTTFLQYVHDRQIHRAVELLQNSDLPLEQIAQQCGFTNLLTFRRNFKAIMNMNPSDFRKE